jgi:outer membrane protein assembly factor BamB
MQTDETRPRGSSSIPEPSWRVDAHATGSPIIHEDVLISETVCAGGIGISAFDVETGRERWWNTEAAGRDSLPAFLATYKGTVLSNSGKGVLYGIDPSSGQTLWRFRISEKPAYIAEFVTQGDMLYAAAGNTIFVFSLDSKEKKGEVEAVPELDAGGSTNAITSICRAGGNLYAVCFSQIVAIELERLRPVWRYEAGNRVYFGNQRRKPAHFRTELIVAGDDFTKSPTETLFALDTATGKKFWSFSPPSGLGNFDPLPVNGCLLHGYRLSLLDLSSRQAVWASSVLDAQPNPLPVAESIYAATGQGIIVRVDVKTGASEKVVILPRKQAPVFPVPEIEGGPAGIASTFTTRLVYHEGFFYFGALDAETGVYSLYKVRPADGGEAM